VTSRSAISGVNPMCARMSRSMAYSPLKVRCSAGKGAQKKDVTGVLADVDKSAGAGGPGAEAADIAGAVCLGHTEKRLVEAPAVVEIELGRLIDDRRGIGHGAKVEPGRGDAANAAGLDGQGNAVN